MRPVSSSSAMNAIDVPAGLYVTQPILSTSALSSAIRAKKRSRRSSALTSAKNSGYKLRVFRAHLPDQNALAAASRFVRFAQAKVAFVDIGRKYTFLLTLHPKADMCSATRDVR